jgi:hypothetical protein
MSQDSKCTINDVISHEIILQRLMHAQFDCMPHT